MTPLDFNWVDLFIIVVCIIYALEGLQVGFIAGFLDFTSFALSFIFGLKFYSIVGYVLVTMFAIPQGFANALGFFLAAFASEIIVGYLLRKVASRLPKEYVRQQVNRMLGFIPGIFSALVLSSFLLTLIVALPFSSFLKRAVASSAIGNTLVAQAQGFEKGLQGVFGLAVNETINFLTVKPQSDESVSLRFKTTNVSVDEEAQDHMLVLINKERAAKGLEPLTPDPLLTEVGHRHARDMFERGYFSHYTPEGASPFDRMAVADIAFTYAGENLALAPNSELAMQGLMESEGHRANILSPNFGKVGIGVIDGGIYGEMFTQEFTD